MTAGEIFSRFTRWREGVTEAPLGLYIVPTQRCNLSCVFCKCRHWKQYAHQEELQDEEWLRILQEAAEYGAKWVDIQGGEPLIRKNLVLRIAELANRCGLKGSLVTNGLLLTRTVASKLVHNEWDLVQVSIDAPVPRIHNQLRMSTRSFSAALRCVKCLAAEKKLQHKAVPKVQINMVLTNRTLGMLSRMVRLADTYGADRIKFIPMVLSEKECEGLMIQRESFDELAQEIEVSEEVAKSRGIETNLVDLRCSLEKGADSWEAIIQETFHGEGGYPYCYGPWWALKILPQGGATCCVSLEKELVNIRYRSVKDIWTCEEFERVRRQLLSSTIDACEECCYVVAAENIAIRECIS